MAQPAAPVTGAMRPQPCVLVIFGGDGDLAWRKLLPAVYNLNVDGVLPSHFAVVCFGLPSTKEGESGDPDEYIRKRARDGISKFSRQPLVEHLQDRPVSEVLEDRRHDDEADDLGEKKPRVEAKRLPGALGAFGQAIDDAFRG